MAGTGVANGLTVKLITQWEQGCEKLAALAEEIPSGKFNYKPQDGVRTVAEVLRHVAFWNRYVKDAVLGRKADDKTNELPAEKFGTKTQIIDALRQSGLDATSALKKNADALSSELLETLVAFLGHNCEHYGQLVVYARLNGIVPPVSRG